MEQMQFDYTQDPEDVARAELRAKTPQNEIDEFVAWTQINPEAVPLMLNKAMQLAYERSYVSVSYVLSWLRYESGMRFNQLDGTVTRDFKAPNQYATIFARYLQSKSPLLRECIDSKPSQYDNCNFPSIDWGE